MSSWPKVHGRIRCSPHDSSYADYVWLSCIFRPVVVTVSTSLQFGSAGKFDSRKETISVANVSGLSTADGSTAVLEAVNHFMMVVMASMIGKNIYGVLLDL